MFQVCMYAILFASTVASPLPMMESSELQEIPCEQDLANICGMTLPESYQAVYDARMCLWGSKDLLSEHCVNYLLNESPSLLEPCYVEIGKYCKNVVPGSNRVSECIQKIPLVDLSNTCGTSLKESLESVSEEHVTQSNALRGASSSTPNANAYISNLMNNMYTMISSLKSDVEDLVQGTADNKKQQDDDFYKMSLHDDDSAAKSRY